MPTLTRDDAVAALDFVFGVHEWDSDQYAPERLMEQGPEAWLEEHLRVRLREAIALVTAPLPARPKRKRPSAATARARAVTRALETLRRHAPHLLAENAPTGVR